MFLTEAHIDYLEVTQKRDGFPHGLSDSYAWHKAAWQAFPNQPESKRNYLTRLDRKPTGYRLLIVSQTLPEKPAWWNPDQWRTQKIPTSYFEHSHFAFETRVNPTKKIRVGSTQEGTRKKNGARVPLTNSSDLITWLERKAESGGFIIQKDSLQINAEGQESFFRKGTYGTHNSINFKGILQVIDPEKFISVFAQGLGSAKGFGFGLLILSPLKEITTQSTLN